VGSQQGVHLAMQRLIPAAGPIHVNGPLLRVFNLDGSQENLLNVHCCCRLRDY
jgi:hypothetical protein